MINHSNPSRDVTNFYNISDINRYIDNNILKNENITNNAKIKLKYANIFHKFKYSITSLKQKVIRKIHQIKSKSNLHVKKKLEIHPSNVETIIKVKALVKRAISIAKINSQEINNLYILKNHIRSLSGFYNSKRNIWAKIFGTISNEEIVLRKQVDRIISATVNISLLNKHDTNIDDESDDDSLNSKDTSKSNFDTEDTESVNSSNESESNIDSKNEYTEDTSTSFTDFDNNRDQERISLSDSTLIDVENYDFRYSTSRLSNTQEMTEDEADTMTHLTIHYANSTNENELDVEGEETEIEENTSLEEVTKLQNDESDEIDNGIVRLHTPKSFHNKKGFHIRYDNDDETNV